MVLKNMFYEICIVLLYSAVTESYTTIDINFDLLNYKIMKRNETLKIECKNKINSECINWIYPNIPHERVIIHHGQTSVLKIYNATDTDTGIYKCCVPYTFHDGRKVEIEEIINVAVEPILDLEDFVSIYEGDKLELNCSATRAYPTATIDFWKIEHDDKNHVKNIITKEECDDDYCEEVITEYHKVTESNARFQLETHLGIPKSRLVIEKAATYDSGKYTCQFKNIAGSANRIAVVKVEASPRRSNKLKPKETKREPKIKPEITTNSLKPKETTTTGYDTSGASNTTMYICSILVIVGLGILQQNALLGAENVTQIQAQQMESKFGEFITDLSQLEDRKPFFKKKRCRNGQNT